MSTPITQFQVVQDSILDLNGRQTYLGNSFMLPAAGTSLTDTTETPIALIKNLSTNTKSLFIFRRLVMSNNNTVLARFYLNPTVNVLGTATAPKNMRTASATTSVSLCYLGMTITANGTLLQTVPGSQYGIDCADLIIQDPNYNILITAQQAGAGTSLAIPEIAWYEL